MEDFLTSCVERYLELAGPGTKMRTVATPFLADDQNKSLVRKPLHEGPCIECPWCKHTFKYPEQVGGTAAPALLTVLDVIVGRQTTQPFRDDIGNCIIYDYAIIGKFNPLFSPGRNRNTTSFVAA
eukprot:6686019-Heterocapsa_arctica.AAC.1